MVPEGPRLRFLGEALLPKGPVTWRRRRSGFARWWACSLNVVGLDVAWEWGDGL